MDFLGSSNPGRRLELTNWSLGNLGSCLSGTCSVRIIRRWEEVGLIDITPTILHLTWLNNHVGDARVMKRLDRLLISDFFLQEKIKCRQWVAQGGNSSHLPIIPALFSEEPKPQMNYKWTKDNSYNAAIREIWIPIMTNLLTQ